MSSALIPGSAQPTPHRGAAGPTVQLVSGAMFDFLYPERAEFYVDDIAHALAHLCRFTGHTTTFYSVAQHCVLVSEIVPPNDAKHALLHDASEFVMGDVPRPLKTLLPDYLALEAQVQAAIFKRFGLSPELPESVKTADLVLLATEFRDVMGPSHSNIGAGNLGAHIPPPLETTITPWPSCHAKQRFWQRWVEVNRMESFSWTRKR